ncbi:MAG: hypothetical protein U9P10_05505 [Thermodesulfobacteriota bacterium]|nr:hypothetical protein [Thermodesulfobacteriota bacterium]
MVLNVPDRQPLGALNRLFHINPPCPGGHNKEWVEDAQPTGECRRRLKKKEYHLKALDLKALDLKALDLKALDLKALDLKALDLKALERSHITMNKKAQFEYLKKDFYQGFPAFCGFEENHVDDGVFETILKIQSS